MKKLIATILIMQAWSVIAATEVGCNRNVINSQTLVLKAKYIDLSPVREVNMCIFGPQGVTIDPQFNTTIRAGGNTLTLKSKGRRICSGRVVGYYADYKLSGNDSPRNIGYEISVNIPYQDTDIKGNIELFQGLDGATTYHVVRDRKAIALKGIRSTVTYQDMEVDPGLTPMRVNYAGWGTSLPSIKYDIRPSAADGLSVLFDNGGTSLTQKSDAAPVINVKDNGASPGKYARVIDATLTCP